MYFTNIGALDVKEDIFTWARMVGEMKTGKKLSSYSEKELMAYQEVSKSHIKQGIIHKRHCLMSVSEL